MQKNSDCSKVGECYLRCKNMEITSKLPDSDIQAIIALVRTHTDEVIISISDDAFGPAVK